MSSPSYENNMLKIYIKAPFIFQICAREICEKFVYKHSKTIKYANYQSAASLSVFKKNLSKFTKPLLNSVFTCHNCKGIKYLTRLQLGLSHSRKRKSKHSFQDTLTPFC